MKLFILFAVALAAGSVSCQTAEDETTINNPNCGRRLADIEGKQPSANRIVGGSVATRRDFNWQIALSLYGEFICGGILINSRWVLSAAHCIDGESAPWFSVRLGHHDNSIPERHSVSRKVAAIYVHPSYIANEYTHDIALIKLASPVTYSTEIGAVCLPDGSNQFVGYEAIATGWGAKRPKGAGFRFLQQVSLPLLSDARCKQKFGDYVDVKLNICAGDSGFGKDTCDGDSGGPLVVKNEGAEGGVAASGRYYSIGVTSFGSPGCDEGAVYVRTSAYLPWIKKTISTR